MYNLKTMIPWHLLTTMFVVIDKYGIITVANKKACEIFEYPENEIIGKNIFENLLSFPINKMKLQLRENILSKKTNTSQQYTISVLTKRGEKKLIKWEVTPINDYNNNTTVYLFSGEQILSSEINKRNTAEKNLEVTKENLRLKNIALIKENKKLIKAKQKAIDNENKYKQLTDATFEGVAIHINGIALDVNISFSEIFGYSRKELIGQNIIKLCIIKKHHNIIAQNITKNIVTPYEVNGIKKDGTIFPIEIEAKSIKRKADKRILRVAAVRDITKRKNDEKAIREGQKQYQQLFYSMSNAACIVELVIDNTGQAYDYRYLYANPLFLKYLNKEPQEFINKTGNDINASDIPLWINLCKRLESDKKPFSFEYYYKQKHHWYYVKTYYISKNKFGATFYDINGIKEAKQELQDKNDELFNIKENLLLKNRTLTVAKEIIEKNERTYRNLIDNLFDGYYRTDSTGRLVFVSPSVIKMLGYSASELLGNPMELFYTHLKSQELFIERIKNEKIVKGLIFEAITKNRGNIYVKTNSQIVYNSNDEFDGIEGIFSDVTKQLEIEEKFKNSEDKINLLLKYSNNLAVMINPKGIIITCNDDFARAMHKKREELIGNLFFQFLPNEILKKNMKLDRFLKRRIIRRYEREFDNKYYDITINPILDSSNKVKMVALFARDITNIVKTQKEVLRTTIQAEERERLRIAEELHDGVSPMLSALKLYIQSLPKFKKKEVVEELYEKLNSTINETINCLSEISNNLSPHVLQDYGLSAAINNYIERLINVKGIRFKIEINLNGRVNPIIETTIYRIIIELINNTMKHSKANLIYIKVEKKDTIIFKYTDNGIGFDYVEKLKNPKGMGLRNIVSRVKSQHGTIDFISNNGLSVNIRIPLI